MSATVPPAVEHYALTGCYGMPGDDGQASLDLALVAGRVLGGDLTTLRRVWEDMPPRMKKNRRAFAAAILAGRLNPRGVGWPDRYGLCPAHALVAPEDDACPS